MSYLAPYDVASSIRPYAVVRCLLLAKCPYVFTDAQCCEILGPDDPLIVKMRDLQVEAANNLAGRTLYCPNVDCGKAVETSRRPEDDGYPQAVCPHCAAVMCVQCQAGAGTLFAWVCECVCVWEY